MKVLERDANYLPKKVKATIDLEFDISVTVTPSHGRGGLSRILVSVPGTPWSLKRDIVPNDLDTEVDEALKRFFAHVKDRWWESMRAPEPTPQQPQFTPNPEPLRRFRTGTAAISAARDYYHLSEPSITTLSPTEQEMRRREAVIAAANEIILANMPREAEALTNDMALTVTGYNPHPLEAAIASGSGLTADEERELDEILEAAGDEGEDNGAELDLDEEPPF